MRRTSSAWAAVMGTVVMDAFMIARVGPRRFSGVSRKRRGRPDLGGPTLPTMETYGRYLNVVDVEATCWAGKQPPDQVSEIIEIGLTVVDVHERVRVEKHQIMVRPARS